MKQVTGGKGPISREGLCRVFPWELLSQEKFWASVNKKCADIVVHQYPLCSKAASGDQHESVVMPRAESQLFLLLCYSKYTMLKATVINENEMRHRQHENVREVCASLFLLVKTSLLWRCSTAKRWWRAESCTGATSSQRRAGNCNVPSGYQSWTSFSLVSFSSAFCGMWAFLGKVWTSLVLGSLPTKWKYSEEKMLWNFRIY